MRILGKALAKMTVTVWGGKSPLFMLGKKINPKEDEACGTPRFCLKGHHDVFPQKPTREKMAGPRHWASFLDQEEMDILRGSE